MKKIMSLMLGLSLFTGAATLALAQDDKDKAKDAKKKGKGKKGGDKKDDKR